MFGIGFLSWSLTATAGKERGAKGKKRERKGTTTANDTEGG
jgi:hypothetical protein